MTRQVVLLRVGIDSGCGGIQGPLLENDTFEFICIPDKKGVSIHTYGTMVGNCGRPFADFFPKSRRDQIAKRHIHVDPEFETFTYGDPGSNKRSLRKLQAGDVLVFYCGLQKWSPSAGWIGAPALYLAGMFVVEIAGLVQDLVKTIGLDPLKMKFANNFHVRYPILFELQKDALVLVKGGPGSRLFRKARCISEMSTDRSGKPLKILSKEMQKEFGGFGGRLAIQRSMPRRVDDAFVDRAINFLKTLE